MAAAARSVAIVAFLTDTLRAILRRRLREQTGLALLTRALLGAIARATWAVQDPSLSHATQKPIRNLLGYPGAIFSDLAMQLLGLASVLLLAPEALLGYRLLTHRELGDKWRSLMWVLTTLLWAAFASTLPIIGSWPLPTGLGGVFGDALLRGPAALTGGSLGFIGSFVAGVVTGFAALLTTAIAADIRIPVRDPAEEEEDVVEAEDEEDADRAAPWLGLLVHALLSMKPRLWLLLRPRPRKPLAAASGRQEPRFGGLNRVPAPSMTPAAAEDDYVDVAEVEEEEAPAPRKRAAPRAPARKSGSGFDLPSLNLLAAQKASERSQMPKDVIGAAAASLESVLGDFGVRGEIINARPGPVVTLYELEPAPGIKSSRVIGLADDFARSMSAVSARVAVVSGRNAIGIELPNPTREKVYLRELLSADDYNESTTKQPHNHSKTIGGESVIVDLARMPHLLIAGTTGSGKSVAINTMILSQDNKQTPDQCRLIMVDPKMLELSVYDGIPHLLTPVVTDPKKAVVALKWAVREMEGRGGGGARRGGRGGDGGN